MSVIKSETEKFSELMEGVNTEIFHAPTAILEGRQASIKKAPLHEARVAIDKKNAKKKQDKKDSLAALNEAAEQISGMYSNYVLEGMLDSAKTLHPENAEKIEALKIALAEAASKAGEFLV